MLIFATSFVIEKINILRIRHVSLDEEGPGPGNPTKSNSSIFDASTPEQSYLYSRGFSLQEVKPKWGGPRINHPGPELVNRGQVEKSKIPSLSGEEDAFHN
jgi:hypothetical protein